jgi:hypothetical protein
MCRDFGLDQCLVLMSIQGQRKCFPLHHGGGLVSLLRCGWCGGLDSCGEFARVVLCETCLALIVAEWRIRREDEKKCWGPKTPAGNE